MLLYAYYLIEEHITRTDVPCSQYNYQVRNCVLRPRGPSHSGPPILIGARLPRMLRLAARYADAWNTVWHIDPKVVQERYAEFQRVCRAVGRDPATIELTAGTVVRLPQAGEEQGVENVITGTPEEVANRLRGFADVGVRHLMIVLEPSGVAPIEQFGRVLELLRSWSV